MKTEEPPFQDLFHIILGMKVSRGKKLVNLRNEFENV